MSRSVRDLRQIISQSRQELVDDSSKDEQENNDDVYCQAANALSKQIGQ